jgi:hypothetical protein
MNSKYKLQEVFIGFFVRFFKDERNRQNYL